MEKSFENGVYYSPGKRVLYYFSFTKLLPVVFIFIILEIALPFFNNFVNSQQAVNLSFLSINSGLLTLVGIIVCLIALMIAWVKYKSVQFMFDEFAFHIKKGFLSKSEIAIPYRQIQNISHSQSLSNKMMGIMNIVIETAGEDEPENKVDGDGILPVLDAKIALSIEQELLSKPNLNLAK